MFFRSSMLLYVTLDITTKKYAVQTRVKTVLVGFTRMAQTAYRLPYAGLRRRTGHEIRVDYFVRLNPLSCFEIIQVYAAMVAHLRLAGTNRRVFSPVLSVSRSCPTRFSDFSLPIPLLSAFGPLVNRA